MCKCANEEEFFLTQTEEHELSIVGSHTCTFCSLFIKVQKDAVSDTTGDEYSFKSWQHEFIKD